MFMFETEDGKRRVFFKHNRVEVPARHNKEKSKPHMKPVSTVCTVVDSDESVLAETKATCRGKDLFSYAIGRKKSLKGALEKLGLSREERAAAWGALHQGKFD